LVGERICDQFAEPICQISQRVHARSKFCRVPIAVAALHSLRVAQARDQAGANNRRLTGSRPSLDHDDPLVLQFVADLRNIPLSPEEEAVFGWVEASQPRITMGGYAIFKGIIDPDMPPVSGARSLGGETGQ